jgi:hypothetical protein
MVSFMPWQHFTQGRSLWYLLVRRLDGARASLDDVEKHKFLTLMELEL